jgi:hypothetical protein
MTIPNSVDPQHPPMDAFFAPSFVPVPPKVKPASRASALDRDAPHSRSARSPRAEARAHTEFLERAAVCRFHGTTSGKLNPGSRDLST